MTAEWMPVNPCTPECRQRDNYCPPKSRFGCEDYHVYKGEVEYQKKLLEYLKQSSKGFTKIYHWWDIESMLKDLEKGQ